MISTLRRPPPILGALAIAKVAFADFCVWASIAKRIGAKHGAPKLSSALIDDDSKNWPRVKQSLQYYSDP